MGVRISEASLRGVGVELQSHLPLRLVCEACGQVYQPNIRPGGGLPRGW